MGVASGSGQQEAGVANGSGCIGRITSLAI